MEKQQVKIRVACCYILIFPCYLLLIFCSILPLHHVVECYAYSADNHVKAVLLRVVLDDCIISDDVRQLVLYVGDHFIGTDH